MSNNECTPSCKALSIIASIIIGVITAILYAINAIVMTAAFSWALLGIAIVYLAIIFAHSVASRKTGCICINSGTLLTGTLGTILLSIIMLGIGFTSITLSGIILSGLTLFFFSLMITSIACIIKCATCID